MFLLPGEEAFFQGKSWCKLEKLIEPLTGEHLFFLTCSGTCPREERPLACRTFPLLPVLTDAGELELQLDSMGLFLCPLVQADNIELLHPAFRRRAMRAWKLLLGDPLLYELVRKASAAKQKQEPWEKLCKMR
jgi:hypothetical protein